MQVSNTSERLNYLMKTRNLKQSDILEKCKPYCKKYNVKMGRNDLSQYVSGKAKPRQNKLSILALALNVSETWLMGYDVESDDNNKIWINDLGYVEFTKKEMSEIQNFCKYLLSKR